jgi:hypothetical protein
MSVHWTGLRLPADEAVSRAIDEDGIEDEKEEEDDEGDAAGAKEVRCDGAKADGEMAEERRFEERGE